MHAAEREWLQPLHPNRSGLERHPGPTTHPHWQPTGKQPPEEFQIAPYRTDDTLRPWTTIWVLRVGDNLYVRSYHGRHAAGSAAPCSEARAGSALAALNVTSASWNHDQVQLDADRANQTRYAPSGDTYVKPMVGADATAATFRLVPADPATTRSPRLLLSRHQPR